MDLRTCERLRVTSRTFYSDSRIELRSPRFLEGDGPISRALARHQPVVAVEQDIGSQVRRVGFEDYREISGNRRVTETEVRRMQYQQAARLEAAGEIGDLPVEALEVKDRVAALRSRGGEIAANQHRQAEDRVISARGLASGARRGREGHVDGLFRAHAREATGDIAPVDVDAFEAGLGEIPAQAENFVAAGAPERQDVERTMRGELAWPRIRTATDTGRAACNCKSGIRRAEAAGTGDTSRSKRCGARRGSCVPPV